MAKGRLIALLLLLVLIGGIGFYSQLPHRFDGSSADAFQESADVIYASLPEGEKVAFKKDIENALMAVADDNPDLLVKVMLSGLDPQKGKQAQAELMERLRKVADEMTLEEFRDLAAKGRGKKEELLGRLAGSGPQRGRVRGPGRRAPTQPMWDSEEELLAAAPQVELVTREMQFRNTTFLIDIPEDATIDDAKIKLSTGEHAAVSSNLPSMAGLRENALTNDYNGFDTIAYSDQHIFIEKLNDEKGSKDHPYETSVILPVTPYRIFGAQIELVPEGKYSGEATKLEPALLLIRCLKSLRLKTPDPDNPVALLRRLGAKIVPEDAREADEVSGLTIAYDANAADLGVVPQLPNIRSLEFSSSLRLEGQTSPLAKVNGLVSLSIGGTFNHLTEADLPIVFGNQGLQNLTVSMSNESATQDWFKRLTELEDLNQLSLRVEPAQLPWLDVLRESEKLRGLELEFVTGSIPKNGLNFLAAIPQLESLTMAIGAEAVDQEVTQAVAKAIGLRSLSFTAAAIDGQAIQQLASLKSLERLSIYAIRKMTVVPDDFGKLKDLPLKYVYLYSMSSNGKYPAVSDADLAELARVKTLEEIHVESDCVTIEGLKHLATIPALRKIKLSFLRSLIESEDLDAFRQAHPNLEVR